MDTPAAQPPPSPFGATPPSLADEAAGVYSWLVEPAGMVNRYADVFVSVASAEFITGSVDAAMHARFPGGTRFLYVHDFSRATGYAAEARRILTSWGVRERKRVESVVIVPPPMHALFRMGVQAAALALRVAGVHVEIVPDLARAIWKYHLKPARPHV
jgi:hypothetical protein